jgi:hypothetical protein
MVLLFQNVYGTQDCEVGKEEKFYIAELLGEETEEYDILV